MALLKTAMASSGFFSPYRAAPRLLYAEAYFGSSSMALR
jgi:hypothetical protein